MTTREVVLDGGSPWGFRLHGGADVNQPLRISRVNPGSKAALRGIREGDFITSINSRSTKDISNAEAHALLRNSGDTLKLGLNEEVSGSPKRRQYKTVHQETHSETVKKSSVTSYTVTSSKTVETNNEVQTSTVNGNANSGLNGDTYDHPKNSIASQRSTLSSNSTSSSSYTSLTSPSGSDMADNARSRRRRRNNRRRARQNLNSTEIIVEESVEFCDVEETKGDYKLESPKRIKSPEGKKPVKSRSLDDDDSFKIQELSEVSESDDKSECKAIISEAESDIEWEVTSSIEEPKVSSCTSTLDTFTLPLEQHKTEQVSLMSPEEELSLRNFLEGLNLVNSPEDAFRQIRDFSTMESVKTRRAKKRAALEQYFTPIMQNPRFLDVISEEASDLSDREIPVTQHLKQGTPEPDLPQGRPPKSRRIIENPTILVETKMVDVPYEISTTNLPQSKAEVVFLEDSSNSTTPDPKSDDDEKSANDDLLSSANSSVPDLRESEVVEETKQVKVKVKRNDILVSSSENLEGEKWNTRNSKVELSELTPPPTPDEISPKNETLKNEQVSIIQENFCKRDGRIFDQNITILDLTARDESEGPEVVRGKLLFSVPTKIDNGSKVSKEKIINTSVERCSQDDEISGGLLVKKEKDSTSFATEPEEELQTSERATETISVHHSDAGSTTAIVEPKIPQERILDIEIEKESKDAQNRSINLTSKMIPSCAEVKEMEINKESTSQDQNQISDNRNVLFNLSNMPAGGEVRRENIIEVKREEGCKLTQRNNFVAQTVSKSTKIPTERIIEVKLEGYNEPNNAKCEDISNKLHRPVEKIVQGKLEKQEEIKDSCLDVTSKELGDTKERLIKIEVEDKSGDKSAINQTESAKETIIEVKLERKRCNDDPSKGASDKLKGAKYNLETESKSAQDFVTKDIPKTADATKERIIEVELENRSDALQIKDSYSKHKSGNKQIPTEKNIDIKLEQECGFAQDVDRSGNILNFSGSNELPRSESTFAQNKKNISEDIYKKSEVTKERIIKIDLEKESDAKDTPNKLGTLRKNDPDLDHNISNKVDTTHERIIHVEIAKSQSVKDQHDYISSGTVLTTPTAPKERIIEIEIEKQSKSAQNQIKKSETMESSSRFGKPESAKDRIVEVKLENSNSDHLNTSNDSFHRSKGTKEVMTTVTEHSRSTQGKKQGGASDDLTHISEIPRERIIDVKMEDSNSMQKTTEVTTSISGQPFQIPEVPKERIINVTMEESDPFLSKTSKTCNSVFQKSEVTTEKIIEALKANHCSTPVESGHKSGGPRERVIDVTMEDSNPAHNTTDTTQLFQKAAVPKERIINVKIEDSKPGQANTSRKVFQKSESTKETIVDGSDSVKSRTPIELFQKTGGSVEKIIDVKLEDSTFDQTKTGVISPGQLLKPDLRKERIIDVIVEDSNPSLNISKDVFRKSEVVKDNIINVRIESLETRKENTQNTAKDFCQKTRISKDVHIETPKFLKERIIDVKIEDSKPVRTKATKSVFQESDISKENIIDVKIEDLESNQKKTRDFLHKPGSPRERIINVKIEDSSSAQNKTENCKFTKEKIIEITQEKSSRQTKMDQASQQILKLDDVRPPVMVTPTSPESSEKIIFINVESKPEHKAKNDEAGTKVEDSPSSTFRSFLGKGYEDVYGGTEPEEGKPYVRIELEGLSTLKSLLNDESKKVDSDNDVTMKLESPSKEVEHLCTKMKQAESVFYTNVLSPPAPSPSPSLSSGSSRATSLCTAKYNSMSSSLADITSINDDFNKSTKIESPVTLRELCVRFLMSLPFGPDILQELADVSSSIEHFTRGLVSGEDKSCKKGLRLKIENDPSLYVCVSPTPKAQLDKSVRISEEASKLLDLHQKYIYRATYHDPAERQVKNEQIIKPRLLAIIRDAQEPKIKKFSTLPRNMESARLKAKDLSEWLKLARTKSHSVWDITDENSQNAENYSAQRRKSLPDIYERQMQYLQQKEKEIERELEMLEEEKRKLGTPAQRTFRLEDYHISKRGDFAENKKSRPLSMPVSTEHFRQQMYEEYMDKIAAREERKQHKVIKVSQIDALIPVVKTSGIEDEFMNRVKEKQKLGKLNSEEINSEDEVEEIVPKHLREFLEIAETGDGVWSPGQRQEIRSVQIPKSESKEDDNEPLSPVWTPKSATSSPTVDRKEFRPVKFESPVLNRKNYQKNEDFDSSDSSKEPPWKVPETSSDTGIVLSSTLEKRLPTSHSSPASGFNDLPTTRLPRAQNPTITLLQKAREGQLPKGALYIEQEQHSLKRNQNERPPLVGPGEILYKIKNEYTSESDSERPRKMADLGARKFEGIGPTTKDGMPLILRSEVKDANQSKWYKKMYDTIHKQRPHRDEFVTVRYKQRRGQYPYTSGYLSEPEPGAYDSDFADYKYATLDRRRVPKDRENDYLVSSTMPRSAPDKVGASVIKHGHDPYKNQPGRIENYIPGHSSISEKEAKEWWDEVMDIFDGHLEQQKRVPQTKSFINQALKESGYESDSTLVFRRRDDTAQQLSPLEQKEAYKTIQKGGDVPLYGLRKPAPERPKESPRKYVENEVTIHYKTPVRQEIKEYLSEDELAYRQAEAMKKIYQEERRRKYLQVSKSLQELQDMNSRRHTDNFIPSQKSPIPLNRYDDLDDLAPPVKPRPRSPEPRLMARALYNFVGQTARELTFRKGDLIYVRRQVDKNWYEGELNAMVGLFPVNYIEIVTYDSAKPTPRKSHEGQARAKYNFVAQTHLELSLAKGELVVITRRVDDNWFEGKIGGRKGIFPVSYVDVLIDPNDPPPPPGKPVAAPAAHSLLLNGSAGGKESMGSHSYTPNLSSNQLTSSYHAKPAQVTGSYGSVNRGGKNPVNQALHIETQTEPIPYRALYKYLPQNDDELELLEGDTVYVLEKCDDGWYVGSSDRTGAFGTFPGNYVEKI